MVSVLVTGEDAKVKGVLVTEERAVDRANPNSPLNKVLGGACRTDRTGESCVVGAARFQRLGCMGGWLLVPFGFNAEKASADCARWAPLLEDARREKR